uniref:Uncharacterized protein n=1 Tax=Romanomermis culicivorax TaxID=13658 RepID=A0A915J7I0_ROMCU
TVSCAPNPRGPPPFHNLNILVVFKQRIQLLIQAHYSALGDGFKGQKHGSYRRQGSEYGNPKRFGLEGMRMRVGGRGYQNVSSGRQRGSQSTATR